MPHMTESALAQQLRSDIQRSGYYPDLVADALETALKQAVQSRLAQTTPTYDLTVQNVDQPGLPAPRKPLTIASAPQAKKPTDADLENGEDPGADLVLREAQNILVDYIHAWRSASAPKITAKR